MEFYHTHFDKLLSTNMHSVDLIAKSNPIDGTVISTYNQTDGNGQIGRKWYSDVDKNITTSIILYPDFLSIDKVFYLNIVLSLAIRRALEKLSSHEFFIKWPNDLYYKDTKIAGLLIQQSIMGKSIKSTVLGYGVNINQESFPASIPNPISLYNIIGEFSDLDQVQSILLTEVKDYYTKLKQGSYLELKTEYLSYMYKRGELCEFQGDRGKFEAEILGIGPSGKLALNKMGEIFHYELNQLKYIIS